MLNTHQRKIYLSLLSTSLISSLIEMGLWAVRSKQQQQNKHNKGADDQFFFVKTLLIAAGSATPLRSVPW
jgi:hypothetical protein